MRDEHTQADLDFHEATAHLYEPTLLPIFGVYEERVTPRYLDRIERLAPGRRALDLACGTGLVTLPLAQRGFHVTGVDHSPAMMEIARQKVDAAGLQDRVELLEGDIRSLPFDDGSFDVVVCRGVIHHLDDEAAQAALAREVRRVLVPGGVLYTSEPCLGTTPVRAVWDLARGARRMLRRPRSGSGAAPSTDAHDALHVPDHDEGPIDAAAFERLLTSIGFDTSLEYWSSFDGMHRLPTPIYRTAVVVLSRPWRHRRGDLMYLLATRR